MKNVHISSHPSLQTKVSALRDGNLKSSEVAGLAGDIASILAVEASSSVFSTRSGDRAISAAKAEYTTLLPTPSSYSIIPILRSGLSMASSFLRMLPDADVPVYHLGVYREKTTLSPVEYYNKLPVLTSPMEIAFVVDPVIATGGTAGAVIQTLQEWGARKVVFSCIVASKEGIEKLGAAYPDVEFHVGQVDDELTSSGYILPGLGDIGDRLHNTA